MSEWWTYTLSDFLLFSAQTYHRLFELYNRDIWPAQIVALALGAVVLACRFGDAAWRGKAVAAILVVGWLWVAWAFHYRRYAAINWAANYFAIGFVLEALLLAWCGLVRDELGGGAADRVSRSAGIFIFLFALIVQPLVAPMLGRPWLQAEIFGLAPDPTAAATLGLLLLAARRPMWPLAIIPLVWCGISGATLWTMGFQDALIMPVVAVAALALNMRKARRLRRDGLQGPDLGVTMVTPDD